MFENLLFPHGAEKTVQHLESDKRSKMTGHRETGTFKPGEVQTPLSLLNPRVGSFIDNTVNGAKPMPVILAGGDRKFKRVVAV